MAIDSQQQKDAEYCNWGKTYSAVSGFGKARFLYSYEDKERALSIIMSHYSDDENFVFHPNAVFNTDVIEIDIESISAE